MTLSVNVPAQSAVLLALSAVAAMGARIVPPAQALEIKPLACAAGDRPLLDVMKEMGVESKALATLLADSTKNPEALAHTKRLEELTKESLPLCVPKLEAMTDATAKAAEYVEYQHMMSDMTGLSKDLEAALSSNDNSTAATTFGKIRALQRTAHTRFRS